MLARSPALGGDLDMGKRESSNKRRRGVLGMAFLGIVLGAGLAYAVVAWRRALVPETQLAIWPDPGPRQEMSVYQVGEDASREWADSTEENIGSYL
jgi:hypothetical protein